jgi:predicted dehydrogenase
MPDSNKPFRWGILGTGNIARQFCRDLQKLPGHRVHLVGSRSPDRAADFAQEFGGTAADDYQGLLDDPGVDGVYVAVPNTLHAEWTMGALSEGRHVLCEKPLGTSVAEAEQMFAAAEKANRTLVEAFMYRSHPQTQALVAAARDGTIGQLTHIRASFCYRTTQIDGNVRFDSDLAGGALMDVGCYCLDVSLLLADSEPTHVSATTRRHERDVDVMTAGTIGFANGVQATFTCGLDTQCDNTLVLAGTGGYIAAEWPWKPKQDASFLVKQSAKPRQELAPDEVAGPPPERRVETPSDLPLYALEAKAFAATVRDGATPFMTRDDSIRLARLLDRVRSEAVLVPS